MPDIPQDIADFVQAAVPSVWTLETLLLLARQRDREWSVEQLNHELRASLALVADLLRALQMVGLVMEDNRGMFRYCPATPELAGLVERLADARARTPVALLRHIANAPDARLRQLADAFRIRGDHCG